MDREGFRNRLKQYKEAKGFDPLLKYWEWKLKYDSAPQPDAMPGQPQLEDIPTYSEGTHRVAAGESLSSIAKKYKLNLQDLIDYNPQIKNPNVIGIGQEINIGDNSLLPTTEWVDYRELRLKERDIADSTTTINYSVKSGDSLSKIAKDNGLTLKQLLMQNPQITDPNKILIGQNLSITTTKDSNMAAILSVSHRGNYVVVDKVNKKLTVYNKDNKPIYVTESIATGASGDDYNTYVDATYNPLAISYAGDYEGLSDEYINNSTAFANALSSNKQALQKELGLDSVTYNDLAELALGIVQQESNFGTSVRKKIKDAIPDEILNSVKKITRGKSGARSVGMTQIKMSADNDWMQQFYKKHNITPDNILDSAELSAIATIGRLAHMYNNEVRGRTFTGENGINIDPIDAVLYKYMGKNKELTGKTATPEKNIYIQNVKKYAKDWDLLSQTESFAEGGIIPKYDEGIDGVKGKSIPTQEEYITQQITAKKAAALEKSLTRTMPRVPKIVTGEQWNPVTKKVEPIYKEGDSCAYTFSDNYGLNWMGCEDFRLNHLKYGWRQIPWESRQPGDAVLIIGDDNDAKHTMMYDSDNTQGQPLFNHSNGGSDGSAMRKKAKYPHHNPYLTYEFVGTAADSTQWVNDYKKMYGLADGGEVTGPPTYEDWYTNMTTPKLNAFDDAYLHININNAAADLHNIAMTLPGYANKWNEYQRSRPKEDPSIDEFVNDLWENENPNNVGYRNGKYYPHKSPEGGKMTIGPGFKLDSGSHGISTKTANRGMTKTKLNQEARKIGKQHLKAVDRFINYGQTTNPADTVSPQIKMGLMDLRHQVGPLNEWGNLRQAVLEGDLDRIKKESTVTWNDNGKTKVDKRRKKIRDEKYFYYE